MQALATAVLPVFLLILLGYVIRRRGWLPAGFWEPAERLTYLFLLPALLATTLARADFSALPAAAMAGAVVLAIAAMSALLVAFQLVTRKNGPAVTAVLQTSIRPNTYIGLSIPFALYGEPGLAIAALIVAVVVPTVNVVCIAALLRFGDRAAGASGSGPGLVQAMMKNPLILACLLGLALNFSGLGLPPVAGETLTILARAALPLALLAVGAGLDFGAARTSGGWVVSAVALKLAGLPLLTAGFCLLLGVHGLPLTVAVIFNALPAATSSYILARQMGGAPGLVANILTVQTLVAAVTLPLLVLFIV
ncbi:AEC family transporter [Pelagibius marinus]|uniref:AEC family transporter n=1 Tax=Pelagibius marinus TaxID=2762760 RepID=UPI001872DB5B|nr:AEC family transporter [Pelagibius marinus]